MSKKHKNINNKQKYSNSFVTEFDKTLILSQFELFFNILKWDFSSRKQPLNTDKRWDFTEVNQRVTLFKQKYNPYRPIFLEFIRGLLFLHRTSIFFRK